MKKRLSRKRDVFGIFPVFKALENGGQTGEKPARQFAFAGHFFRIFPYEMAQENSQQCRKVIRRNWFVVLLVAYVNQHTRRHQAGCLFAHRAHLPV